VARCFQASLILFSAASLMLSHQVTGASSQRLIADHMHDSLNILHAPALLMTQPISLVCIMSRALAIQLVLNTRPALLYFSYCSNVAALA
jgi:hypothetical protein